MARDRTKYWIALNLIPGIGSLTYRNLVKTFEDPKRVFGASRRELAAVEGIGPKLIKAILNFPAEERLRNELNQMERFSVSVVTYQDPEYPKRLLAIHDFPPVLYVRGDLGVGEDLAVAIVGSRMATRHGKAFTEQLARGLAVRGITVVSGMARGIDSAAHRGALQGRGRTTAVLGCGVDVIYPTENRELMMEIVSRGVVISEFPMGTQPHSSNFPRRNRVISGLVLGVVVVEATRQSGSLITANYALEQGREVFAVPGNVGLPSSQGTNRLLKQGAKLVDRVEDVLEEVLPQWQRPSEIKENEENRFRPNLSDDERQIYGLLGTDPVHIDELITQTQWGASRVSRVLVNLELAGIISQMAGKHFVRI
jgi:DNA processing protein